MGQILHKEAVAQDSLRCWSQSTDMLWALEVSSEVCHLLLRNRFLISRIDSVVGFSAFSLYTYITAGILLIINTTLKKVHVLYTDLHTWIYVHVSVYKIHAYTSYIHVLRTFKNNRLLLKLGCQFLNLKMCALLMQNKSSLLLQYYGSLWKSYFKSLLTI